MTGGLARRGGAGGVHANLEDMRSTSERLMHTEGTFVRAGGESARHMTSGALARTAILTPGTAMQVQISLGQAAASAGALVVGVAAQAFVLRARADLFQLADEGMSRVKDYVEDHLALPLLAGTIVVGAALYVSALLDEGGKIMGGLLRGEIAPADVDDRLRGALTKAGQRTLGTVLGVLSAFPAITDVITGGLPTALDRSTRGRLPGDIEGFIGMLQGIAGRGGLGIDGKVHVRAGTRSGRCVGGLDGILNGVTDLERQYGPGGRDGVSAVRITKLDGEPARWVVEIPGTMSWDLNAGANPSDITSNAQLMQRRGDLMAAIREAMHQAKIPPGDAVMLAGHSQGGIAAAALACDRRARSEFNITNVLTAGSPIGNMPIPDDVQVLSIEHIQDPVPRLESETNPDRANWTTFTRDVGGEPGVSENPIAAHGGAIYAETAGMIPKEDRTSFDAFLGDGTSTTYEMARGSRA